MICDYNVTDSVKQPMLTTAWKYVCVRACVRARVCVCVCVCVCACVWAYGSYTVYICFIKFSHSYVNIGQLNSTIYNYIHICRYNIRFIIMFSILLFHCANDVCYIYLSFVIIGILIEFVNVIIVIISNRFFVKLFIFYTLMAANKTFKL